MPGGSFSRASRKIPNRKRPAGAYLQHAFRAPALRCFRSFPLLHHKLNVDSLWLAADPLVEDLVRVSGLRADL